MACRIIRNTKKEIVAVYAENGNESELYKDLNQEKYKEQGAYKKLKEVKESALEMYATKDTPQFKEWFREVESKE